MPIDPDRPVGDAELSRLLDVAGDILCILDAQGLVRYVNAGVKILGYSRADFLGKDVLSYVHPADVPTASARLESAEPGGPPVQLENRCRTAEGEYRWLTWLVSRAPDGTSAAVLRDATERKWVERELEASLSLVDVTLESTADGILVADKSGNVVTFNRRFLEMCGLSDEVVFAGAAELDRSFEAMVGAAQGHFSLVGELEQAASTERYEVLTLKDGRVVERYSLPRRIRGEIEGRVWSFRDITERVRAERELREHLSMGIEHAVEGIARLDESGCYVAVNAVFAKMLGYDEKEMLGGQWGAGCHPDDRAAVVAAREAVSPEGKTELEARVLRKDGSVAVLRGLIVRADGPRGGHHVFVSDITEQREMQERLLLADRMGSMGRLAAGVAHEINNPLSFVITNVTLLAERLPALAAETGDKRLGELVEVLRDVRDGTERVRKIVRDLKMFSRPEDVRSGAVDVRQVLESSLAMAWSEIRHRARLVKDYAASLMVEGNDAQLGQVFLNLLINAAQAIPEGNVERNEIRVVAKVDPHDPARAIVEIHDTGAGIAPAALPHIFDPFFTTKPVGVGTGLGLSVCHGIVSKLGGEIQVESNPGAGTTFRVLLRRGKDRPKTLPPPVVDPAPKPVPRSRLLVVDDEVMIGNSLRRILAKEYEVVVCTSGRAALTTLAGEAFDLVLCDIMMPDVTGMDVYEELKKSAPEVASRVVFMTGGSFTTRAKDFLDTVPNARLDKPIDVKALRAWLRERLASV
jgi:PAS domain S-box-containing protein